MKRMRTILLGLLAVTLTLTLAGCPFFPGPKPEAKMRTLAIGDTWVYEIINRTTLPDGTAIVSQWVMTQSVVAAPEGSTTDADALALVSSFEPVGGSQDVADDYVIFKQDERSNDLILVAFMDDAGVFHETGRTDILLMPGKPDIGDSFIYGWDEAGVLNEFDAKVSGAAFVSTPGHSDECWIVNLFEQRMGYTMDGDFAWDPDIGGIAESNQYSTIMVSGGPMTNWYNQMLVSFTPAE